MPLLYRSGKGRWEEVPGASYKNEEELRQLLVDSPNILPIEELPGLDTTVQVTVGREAPLGSGYVDVLWIDTEGQLTVVEVKLRKNPEVRREVVAQAVSYAAFLEGMARDDFERNIVRPYLEGAHDSDELNGDLPDVIANLSESDVDGPGFWSGLDASLINGFIRVLIVVDEAHPQLRRTISYLNRHSDFEIYLIEVGFHRSTDRRHEILSPQILDVAASGSKGTASGSPGRDWDLESFFRQVSEKYPDNEPAQRSLIDKLQKLEHQELVVFGFGRGQSGVIKVMLPSVLKSVIWIWSSGSIQFPRYSLDNLGFPDDEVSGYMDRIADASGMPKARYTDGKEPQLVTPTALREPGVVDRVVEVIADIAQTFSIRDE
jgi:hypothetical protein